MLVLMTMLVSHVSLRFIVLPLVFPFAYACVASVNQALLFEYYLYCGVVVKSCLRVLLSEISLAQAKID